MDEDKKPITPEQPENETSDIEQAPSDALSRTPDELEEEQAAAAANAPAPTDQPAEKKPSKLKQFFRKANVYFLLFLLVFVIGAAVTVVNYLNSQKEPEAPTAATKELTEEELKNLAKTDSSVGDVSQTLTIKGNAVIDGQTLMRGNLNIAGNLQTGGSITGPSLTISGTANLGQAQINSLQVASDVAIQGNTTAQGLSVAGSSTFNGPMTASRITVSELVIGGSGALRVPNHLSFTGPTPSRSTNAAQLGSGGTASISGSDTSGTVRITTGNSPTAGCMVRVNFVQSFSKQPYVLISPVGSAAGRSQHYVERDQAGFSICASSPAPANQSMSFDYFVMG